MGKRKAENEIIQKNVKLTRKSASFITRLPVEATGALENVILKGCSKRTWKCLVKSTGIVRPYSNVHKQIKELGEWDEFLKRCLLKPGFKDTMKNTQEMENWLIENARDGSLASLGSDDEKDRIIVLQPGETGSQFLLMGDQVTDPKGFTSVEMEALIPRPAKTKAHKKHTLVLHRSGFSIDDGFENPLTKFKKCDLFLDLESGGAVANRVPNKKFVLVAPNCGVFYETVRKPTYVANSKLQDLGMLIGEMDSGELKSLLQKLIRFAPLAVLMGPNQYDTSEVLQSVCEASSVHPGGKSPNTGLFVRGLPSFLKRLAVTMVEDAWVDTQILHDLLLMSIIASNDPDYFPTSVQRARIYQSAQASLASRRAVLYDHQKAGNPILLRPNLSVIQRASCFLDILKSFPWDLTMLRYVAKFPMEFQESNERPASMDISHYLDHHVGPEFAYFMNPKALKIAKFRYVPSEIFGDLNHCKSKCFAILFRQVFYASSGFNYRRTPHVDMEADELVQIVRVAQTRYFLEKHGHKLGLEVETKTSELSNPITISMELDPMWMASEIGHMTVRVKQQNYFVFITQVEPEVILGVSRVPARNQKDTEIDEVARLEAISLGFQILKKSVKLQANSIFGNREIILKDKRLHFKEKDDIFIPDMIVSMQTSCNLEKIKEILGKMSLSAIRRLWQLSLGFCQLIEFPKITRSGGPDDKPINIHDIEVFQACLLLQPILQLTRLRFFKVTEPIVWWHIRDEIIKPLLDKKKHKNKAKWYLHEDSLQRVPTEKQVYALNVLLERKDQSNFVIMSAGSGKSLISVKHLLDLQKINQLPKHVLFVTPSSAMKSVEYELRQFTDFVDVRDMTKSKKTTKDLARGITLMNHDHMRLAGDLFKHSLPKTHLIIDEFHLCLCQKTLRTNFMLQAASIVKKFDAYSGTPTINANLYDLLPLLSPIVPFELTLNNFFIGYSYAISLKTSSKIEVVRKIMNVPMPLNFDEYWDVLPRSLGGRNAKRLEAGDLNHLIEQSQTAASLKMVELTLEFLKKKDVVFLVARKVGHVQQLRDLLIVQGVLEKEIFCILEQKDAIPITENSKNYKVVIAAIACVHGYSMAICNVQITTIYPSNPSKREQMIGRIKRESSKFKQILYITLICGRIQELIDFRQDREDSLASVLRDLQRDDGLNAFQRKLLDA